MRPSRILVTATLLGLAVAPLPQRSATASCAGPYLENAEELRLRAGAAVVVEGRAFTGGGCQDSMSCSTTLGCDSCEYDDPPAVPMEDVELLLVQGDRTWEVAVADAGRAEDNRLGWVEWEFEVPSGVRPGRAELHAEGAEPVRVRVR